MFRFSHSLAETLWRLYGSYRLESVDIVVYLGEDKMYLKTMFGAAAAVVLSATSSAALTFLWEFDHIPSIDVCEIDCPIALTAITPGLVTGVISGLEEGINEGDGLYVEVFSSPGGDILGNGWEFSGIDSPAFIVTDGEVTFASARYDRSGLTQSVFFGGFGGSWVPELRSEQTESVSYNSFSLIDGGQTRFTLLDTPPPPSQVPLPAALPLMLVAIGGLGIARRRG